MARVRSDSRHGTERGLRRVEELHGVTVDHRVGDLIHAMKVAGGPGGHRPLSRRPLSATRPPRRIVIWSTSKSRYSVESSSGIHDVGPGALPQGRSRSCEPGRTPSNRSRQSAWPASWKATTRRSWSIESGRGLHDRDDALQRVVRSTRAENAWPWRTAAEIAASLQMWRGRTRSGRRLLGHKVEVDVLAHAALLAVCTPGCARAFTSGGETKKWRSKSRAAAGGVRVLERWRRPDRRVLRRRGEPVHHRPEAG